MSPKVCSWIMRPLYDVSCGRCVPVQTIPNWRRGGGGGGADIMLGRTVEAEGLAYLMQYMSRVIGWRSLGSQVACKAPRKTQVSAFF